MTLVQLKKLKKKELLNHQIGLTRKIVDWSGRRNYFTAQRPNNLGPCTALSGRDRTRLSGWVQNCHL